MFPQVDRCPVEHEDQPASALLACQVDRRSIPALPTWDATVDPTNPLPTNSSELRTVLVRDMAPYPRVWNVSSKPSNDSENWHVHSLWPGFTLKRLNNQQKKVELGTFEKLTSKLMPSCGNLLTDKSGLFQPLWVRFLGFFWLFGLLGPAKKAWRFL